MSRKKYKLRQKMNGSKVENRYFPQHSTTNSPDATECGVKDNAPKDSHDIIFPENHGVKHEDTMIHNNIPVSERPDALTFQETCNKEDSPTFQETCNKEDSPAFQETCNKEDDPAFQETCNKEDSPTFQETCNKEDDPVSQELKSAWAQNTNNALEQTKKMLNSYMKFSESMFSHMLQYAYQNTNCHVQMIKKIPKCTSTKDIFNLKIDDLNQKCILMKDAYANCNQAFRELLKAES